MNIDIYTEIKKAIKDALTEWFEENKQQIQQIHSKDEKGNRLLTIKQFCTKHQFVTENGLRAKLFNREFNKFDACCSRAGKRVFIKEKEALEWFSNPPPECNCTYDKKKYGQA